jgi:hypothetical protein
VRIDLKPKDVGLGDATMSGIEAETEIGEETEKTFYPEGIDDDTNRSG